MNSYSTSWWSLLLIRGPGEDERLSWPCWLTYSGRFTHINGYLSAAGPVQTSESSTDVLPLSHPTNQSSNRPLLLEVTSQLVWVTAKSSQLPSSGQRLWIDWWHNEPKHSMTACTTYSMLCLLKTPLICMKHSVFLCIGANSKAVTV